MYSPESQLLILTWDSNPQLGALSLGDRLEKRQGGGSRHLSGEQQAASPLGTGHVLDSNSGLESRPGETEVR